MSTPSLTTAIPFSLPPKLIVFASSKLTYLRCHQDTQTSLNLSYSLKSQKERIHSKVLLLKYDSVQYSPNQSNLCKLFTIQPHHTATPLFPTLLLSHSPIPLLLRSPADQHTALKPSPGQIIPRNSSNSQFSHNCHCPVPTHFHLPQHPLLITPNVSTPN